MTRAALTQAQQRALARFDPGVVLSAYDARESLATLRALVRKGYLADVTPSGPGALFSPQTHYKFMRRLKR